ncbi:transketolase family protein [Atopobium sp. oral taxon 810]|uniref:transketolase family protein n=1 Tax=Atopobium sp. oral taxon 810 TaxID=712158 RepID=UPI00039602FE|nr:transketolase family protein [Atopobium sp. oral taxon 810]ERI05522.1 Transketolase, pyridine binding domain protein [Atopobium sp. oral taxon 810 str. F0209]
MSDVQKIATRASYGAALVELGNEHDDLVVLDADLAAATQTGKFKAAHPERFVDVGIAEANLIGVAAGIATTGRVPFASTFAMFAAGRAFEQIRNSVGYPHLNVKIGATHAGISVGEDGASHQCNEDIALMRTIPGMTVVCPADDVEARALVKAAYEFVGPMYMRFGRLAAPVIHDETTYKFELGRGIVERKGTDVTVVATGLMVGEALQAAEELAKAGIDAEVINIHTIKPLDEELIVSSASKTGKVVTVEEHSIIGGLGSAVCDALAEKCPVPVRKIGVNDTFGESGPAVELLVKYGLSAQNIVSQVTDFLK